VTLDPVQNRTDPFWHVSVQGLPAGVLYAWRVEGPPGGPDTGYRFDRDKALVDPRAIAVSDLLWDRARAGRTADNSDSSIRGVVVRDEGYDWEGALPPGRPPEQSVIYEMHVGGFTRHASSGVRHPGTFAGVVEKIPYLLALGVTDVELLPVMAFDEQDVPPGAAARGLKNYWGYSPHSFFAPHPRYAVSPEPGAALREFRDMVKALHRAGIGLILDVVLNHTAEGGAGGPVINFKGLDNRSFYHLDPGDLRVYRDYTGCGNTVNCNVPSVTAFLTDVLEYWAREMRVDGFRFDLASVLVRGPDGAPRRDAALPRRIELSPVLGRTRLIAEPWDAGGLYQVGDFPGTRWAEWNGRYRDVLRRFVRGEPGLVAEVATRLTGSSDLYAPEGRRPTNSVNFVTCHDGFTLRDLVSYDVKHNEANGDGDRDGSDENLSWNCGVEGETRDPEVAELRRRQAKNFLTLLLLSQGVPMIRSGDEVFGTQRGNNNAYCQDNELSWFDWRATEASRDMLRFVTALIAFRRRHPSLMRDDFLDGAPGGGRFPDVTWHGRRLGEPGWDDREARVLAYTLGGRSDAEEDLHIMINMSDKTVEFEVPAKAGLRWFLAVDTSRPTPADILGRAAQQAQPESPCRVTARSVVVLEGRACRRSR
jgi:glycogen operon protein